MAGTISAGGTAELCVAHIAARKYHGLAVPNPLHILMIAPQPFYEDRGTPIVLRRVLQAISQCGYRVDLITFSPGAAVSIDGLRIFRVGKFLRIKNIPIGFSIKKLLLDMFLLPAILRRLRQQNYDCIHAVEEAAFLALLAASVHKIPLLYDMQSSLPEHLKDCKFFSFGPIQSLLRLFEKFLIQRVDLIACSTGLKEHVQRIAPKKPVSEWLYPTVDVMLPGVASGGPLLDLNIPTGGYVILYTGNFAAYQGVDRLVKAIPLVLEEIPKAIFVFVGSKTGEDLPGLDTCRQSEFAVRVVPRLPQEQMAGFLSLANVVVSPRLPIGNLPLKVFDYMASGKPIVATDSKAHRTVLHDDSAVLVEHKPEAFAAAIVKLYKNPALAERLARTAHQFALEDLGWDTFIGQVRKLYTEVRNAARPAR
jgi:glycosyltransferase involved in cell wall biosynthesis